MTHRTVDERIDWTIALVWLAILAFCGGVWAAVLAVMAKVVAR